jgi:hypothetical protein
VSLSSLAKVGVVGVLVQGIVQKVSLSDSIGAQRPVGDFGDGGRVGDERAARFERSERFRIS